MNTKTIKIVKGYLEKGEIKYEIVEEQINFAESVTRHMKQKLPSEALIRVYQSNIDMGVSKEIIRNKIEEILKINDGFDITQASDDEKQLYYYYLTLQEEE